MRNLLYGLGVIVLIIAVFLLLDIENIEKNMNIAKAISDFDKYNIITILAGLLLASILFLPIVEYMKNER
ncbi:hypothetical protein [Macrococcoides bohemicum]|uniref:hypothetical protein n=1 Tax=Macrococcoides bohemicum TaxID=1903056 RepID=UPI00165E5780|nr:hypothetical protein [Macrococcus bohemicus]MBC9875549.1 hypothetical protein [Macrococcus bohemicus]